MCGIVGVVRTTQRRIPNAVEEAKFMRQALIIDTLRGDDSTGMFYKYAGSKGPAGYIKNAIDGYSFVEDVEVDKLLFSAGRMWFMVGHNRAATVGKVTTATAHPFQEAGVTMVHNGTLHATADRTTFMQKNDVEVDSHYITHMLAENSPEDAVKVIEDLRGAFALVWHDVRDDSLNFVRNSQRPLHFGRASLTRPLYFMSELGSLSWLNTRLRLGIADFVSLDTGKLLKYHQGEDFPEVLDVDLYESSTSVYYGGQGWSYNGGTDSTTTTTGTGVTYDPTDVFWQGQWLPSPSKMRSSLFKVGLTAYDKYHVTPIKVLPTHSEHVVSVLAFADSLNLTFVMHNVPKYYTSDNFDERWTVRPIVYREDIDVVVAKVIAPSASGEETRPRATDKADRVVYLPADDDEEDTGMGKSDDMLLGPGGMYITKDEMDEYIEMYPNCGWCLQPLNSPEADYTDFSWVEDELLCMDCTRLARYDWGSLETGSEQVH